MALKKLKGLLERSLAVIAVPVSGYLKPFGEADEAAALAVHIVDAAGAPIEFGGGSSGADRELVVVTFRVKTAFAGASVGDAITCTQIVDVTGTPSTVSSVWRNQSTGADLGSVPDLTKLEVAGTPGLTDAQLRAAAIGVTQADGGDVAQGAVADAAWSGAGSGTVVAILKAIWTALTRDRVSSGVTVLTGSQASGSTTPGPFTPQLGRDMVLTLSGTWTGSVQLMRSVDGGTTKLPVTVGGTTWALFTANCNEPVWTSSESGATFYLAITVASGTVVYRLAQ